MYTLDIEGAFQMSARANDPPVGMSVYKFDNAAFEASRVKGCISECRMEERVVYGIAVEGE